MKVTFYFVRHGQTLFNVLGRTQGYCDSPLTDDGVFDAENAGSVLRHVPFAKIYSSTSERAMKTANTIAEYHRLAPVLLKDLREFDFGDFDGEKLDTLRSKDYQNQMIEDWSMYHGETNEIFMQRVYRAFETMMQNSQDGDVIGIVSHGSYLMHMMNHMFSGFNQKDYIQRCQNQNRHWVPNGSITIFTYEDGKYTLRDEPMYPDEYRAKYDPKTIHFTFMRHGETLFNVQKRMQGQCDSPLTKKGIQQAYLAKDKLKDIPFDKAYTSTSERARDTAMIVCEDRDIPVLLKDELKEVYYGNLEGEKYEPIFDQLMEHHLNVAYKEYNGENRIEVNRRMKRLFCEIYDSADDDEQILLVSHGDYYMCLLEHYFGWKRQDLYDIARRNHVNPTPNCGICTFTCTNMAFALIKRMDENG